MILINKSFNLHQDRRAFTLVELLVVIAIVGVLAVVGVVSLNSARAKARDAKRMSDVAQISKVLEQYVAAKTEYPIEGGSGDIDMGGGCISEAKGVEQTCTATAADVILLNPTAQAPNAAAGGTDRYYYFSYTSETPTVAAACRTAAADCKSYGIELNLERSLSGIEAGTRCFTARGILASTGTVGGCPITSP